MGAPSSRILLASTSPAAAEVQDAVRSVWQVLLGAGREGERFFDAGGDELMALRLLGALRARYPQASVSWRAFQDEPTADGLARRIAAALAGPAPPDLRARWGASAPGERRALLAAYLRAVVDEASGELEASTPDLAWALRRDLGLPLYAHEVRAAGSIDELAARLEPEVERHLRPAPAPEASGGPEGARRAWTAPGGPRAWAAGERRSIAFLLSAPRSGSTLLRLMLAGHPDLHAPPELNLLHHDGLDAWCASRLARFGARSGVVQNLMRLLGVDEARIEGAVADPAAAAALGTAREAYARLIRAVAPRIVVDKTPSYARSLDTLARAEAWFDRPAYVHLVRHPLAAIDSFVRQRFHALIETGEADPHAAAERVWRARNEVLLEHAARVGPGRVRWVRFEDVVEDPVATLGAVCDLLGVPRSAATLEPYAPGRMAGGPGDYDALNRSGLDVSQAARWRSVRLPRPLDPATRALAERFGYEVPA